MATQWTRNMSIELAAARKGLGLSHQEVDVLSKVFTGSSVRPEELARLENPDAEHYTSDLEAWERLMFMYGVVAQNRFYWTFVLRHVFGGNDDTNSN